MIESIVIIGIILRFLAILIFIFYLLPKQYQEIQVRDGLQFVRWSLFWAFIIIVIAMLENMSYNLYRLFFTTNLWVFMNITSLLNSSKDLLIGVILFLIYHREYRD